jgi:hypothetical protein
MSTEPQPTQQPARHTSGRRFETLDPVRACWPGAPFPAPLLGADYRLLDGAAGAWLRIAADLVLDGEENLNILFAPGPVTQVRARFGLPEQALPLIPAAGLFTLGSLRTRQAGASISSLFALPTILQIARLDQAALLLGDDT